MALLERRTRSLKTYLYLGLGAIALSFLVVAIGIRAFVEVRLQEQADGQARSLSRHRAQQALLLLLMEEEIGLGSYLGTGDLSFLEAYERDTLAEADALATLTDTFPDLDPKGTRDRLSHLEFAMGTWHEQVARPLIVARFKGPLQDLKVALAGDMSAFAEVKAASSKLGAFLDTLDEARQAELGQALGLARWIGLATYGVLFCAGFVLTRWLNRNVTDPLSDLAGQAWAGDGFQEPGQRPSVKEVAILGQALYQLDRQSREREQVLREAHQEALATRAFGELVQHLSSEGELVRALDQALARQCQTTFLRILLRPAAGEGLESASPPMPAEEAATHPVLVAANRCRALSQGAPVDLPSEAATACLCPLGVPPGGGAYLCIPMVASGRTLGLVNLQARHAAHWTANRRHLAEAAVSAASVALQAIRSLDLAREQSLLDGLTGVHNRRFLDEILPKLADQAARQKFPLALLMVDIDHFKAFNDQHGHEGGDHVLRAFAQCLQTHVRGGDVVSRYGGEEFAVLLPHTGPELAESLAERLRRHIQELRLPTPPFPAGAGITTSIGLASYPSHTQVAGELLALADQALYEAKGTGRNRVCSAGNLGKDMLQ